MLRIHAKLSVRPAGRSTRAARRIPLRALIPAAAVAVFILGISVSPVDAQEAAEFYRQNCFGCHTVGGGRLVGPDLKNVKQRKDRDWLVQFILNPSAVIDRGDPYALKILEESRGIVMTTIPGVSRDRANALLDLIETESGLEESQFKGVQVSDRPFTEADVALGRELFIGLSRLEAGGPSCASCHTVRGLGGLSGGRLGPDLTKVYERIGGRTPLAGWLSGPATTTMRPIYQKHPLTSEEILPLVAFFEKTAQEPGEDDAVSPFNFFIIGLLGTVLGLAAFDGLWRKRFRAVRRVLVGEADRGSGQ